MRHWPNGVRGDKNASHLQGTVTSPIGTSGESAKFDLSINGRVN
jgi:hypothetical protein